MKGLINVSEKTRVRLKIVGSEFVVSADEDKDYIVKISKMVDEQIRTLLRQGESMNIAMAAILAALNYCDELEKEKIITEELLRRTEASESLASRLSAEVERLRVENKQLRDEKNGLHKLIDEMDTSSEHNEQQTEQEPWQLSIPLTDSEAEAYRTQEPQNEKAPQANEAHSEKEQPLELKAEDISASENISAKEESVQKEEAADEPKPEKADTAQNQPAPKSPPLTARQMLEEKRRALLAQQKANPRQSNRPKPFRPVSSEKSGGGSFSHGGSKPSLRTSGKPAADSGEFAEIPPEEEMISFFDRR